MTSVYRILSLDPGGATGWATFTAETIEVPVSEEDGPWENEYYNRKWNCGTLESQMHHTELYGLLELQATQDFTIVCESFEYRNRLTKAELISRDYIGVVDLFAAQRGVRVVKQTAAMGKLHKNSFVKRANLERLGLWSPGRDNRHAMDAYGHLLYYMIHNAGVLRSELLLRGWRGDH